MSVIGDRYSNVLPLRPWIRGQLFDILQRKSILHVDAYVFDLERDPTRHVLAIRYSSGGRVEVARDVYLIDENACTLTPIWDVAQGREVTWCAYNAAWMQRLHASVLGKASTARGYGPYTCVSLHCHYVSAPDTDPFKGIANKYQPQTRRALVRAPKLGTLPDLL